MAYLDLVDQLVARSVLQTPTIISAFREVLREHYLPSDLIEYAGLDRPLAIGFGQTNSQPYTVAFMLELLQPLGGQRILDVGCGSGWTTALLAYIAGQEGRVIGTERIAELAQKAQERIEQTAFRNATVLHTPAQLGHPLLAPYDRILVSAAATALPQTLTEQLAPEGIMVIPVQHSIFCVYNTESGIESTEYPGFSFVPLIE